MPGEIFNQLAQQQDIRKPEGRTSGGNHDERISPKNIGPPGRNRAEHIYLIEVVDPVLAPCVFVSYEPVGLAVERVERMDDLKSFSFTLAKGSS